MARICLVGCVQAKQSGTALAKDLYTSPLFRKTRALAQKRYDCWYILSAKYGLVSPDTMIASYDETLNRMPRQEQQEWARRVFAQLQDKLSSQDSITVLAGMRYRENLVPLLEKAGFRLGVPMEGMSIGKQLQWLNGQLCASSQFDDVNRFYSLLTDLRQELGGNRILKNCAGRMKWPKRGVYFFFEQGERRSTGDELRVVRVGTHGVSRGSKATLWTRLRTHRGTSNGQGNHRSSIFRLHVGAALAARDTHLAVPSWGTGQSADAKIRKKEETLERAVSEHIGAMSILWLSIEDKAGPASDRAYVERNLIGLLGSREDHIDPPSDEWLGRFSPDERIRSSGLWNLEFLDYKYSNDFFEVLSEYVSATIGNKSLPVDSIAPRDWYANERQGVSPDQLVLFPEEQ